VRRNKQPSEELTGKAVEAPPLIKRAKWRGRGVRRRTGRVRPRAGVTYSGSERGWSACLSGIPKVLRVTGREIADADGH
jgi:hypothetical protein